MLDRKIVEGPIEATARGDSDWAEVTITASAPDLPLAHQEVEDLQDLMETLAFDVQWVKEPKKPRKHSLTIWSGGGGLLIRFDQALDEDDELVEQLSDFMGDVEQLLCRANLLENNTDTQGQGQEDFV